MIRKTSRKTEEKEQPIHSIKAYHVLFFIGTLLAVLAVLSFSSRDLSILRGGIDAPLDNWIGSLGARFSLTVLLGLGFAGYVAVLIYLLRSLRLFFPGAGQTKVFFGGSTLVILGAMLLFALTPQVFAGITENMGLGREKVPEFSLSGGLIGQVLAAPEMKDAGLQAGVLRGLIGQVGTLVVGWIMVCAGGVMLYASDWHELLCKFIYTPKAASSRAASRKSSGRLVETDDDDEDDDDDEEDDDDYEDEYVEEELIEEPAPKSVKKSVSKPLAAAGAAALATKKDDKPVSRLAQLLQMQEEQEASGVANTPVEPEVEPEIEPEPEVEPEPETAPVKTVAAGNISRETPAVGQKVVREGERLHGEYGEYVVPPITMLAEGTNVIGENQEAVERAQAIIQRTLEEFGVEGHVSGYVSGPRVTRYEITLAPGVSVKKVEQIQENIKMALAATSLRVLAPIPGRPVVGIEVANSKPEAVFMRSVMQSDAWKNTKAEIPLALGKDVSGKPVILDLAKAPHMLVAGATGTGKSVCSNSLIISMLLKFRPDELRLIMVDPKIVEFDAYKTLPHLLTPIINDSAKVPIALRWAANEMDNRYRILAQAGVKKLSEYNAQSSVNTTMTDKDGKRLPAKMPLLVIILDELADLMMTEAKKDVETNITRIAQKGRAAGIHIIVATQRPSTNIITGVIKANLPTRLCFQVRALVDSRVVLDTPGAEKLLGTGDMLFMSSASMNIERVQGAWVKDDDIKKIVQFISEQAPQRFNDQVLAESDDAESDMDEDLPIDAEDRADIAPLVNKYMRPGDDDTMRRALEVVILDRKASTSYIQRRLKIGYNRAAELIDQMEERGIVGPPSGSGNKRDILVFDGIDIG